MEEGDEKTRTRSTYCKTWQWLCEVYTQTSEDVKDNGSAMQKLQWLFL